MQLNSLYIKYKISVIMLFNGYFTRQFWQYYDHIFTRNQFFLCIIYEFYAYFQIVIHPKMNNLKVVFILNMQKVDGVLIAATEWRRSNVFVRHFAN